MIKTTSRRNRLAGALTVQAPTDGVSLRMRQLEQYLSLSLAALTGWMGMVAPLHNAWTVWGGVAVALGVHAWCRQFPARQPAILFARAALLLCMASLVQLHSGAAGPFFFWTATVAAGYAILLTPRWAMAVMALALAQFLGVSLVAGVQGWSDWLIHLGMLVAGMGLATRFAQSLQRTDRELEASLKDRETGLYNVTGLFAHGAQLLAACRRDNEPICLTVLQSPNIGEVSNILGRDAVRDLLADAVKGLLASAQLSGLGLAARTDSGEFVLLLPGVNLERAKTLLRKQLGSPPRVVLHVRDREATVFLDNASLVAAAEHHTPESLYESVRSVLERKREKLAQRMSSSQWFEASQAPESQLPVVETPPAVSRWRAVMPKPKPKEVDSSLMSRLEPNLTLPMPLKRSP